MKNKNWFGIIMIFVVICMTFVLIDGIVGLVLNTHPILHVKETLEYKDGKGVLYKSLFYNYYECDNGKSFISTKDDSYYCSYPIVFDKEDFYTNKQNYKISRIDFELLYEKFTLNRIDNIKDNEELNYIKNIVDEMYEYEYCKTDIIFRDFDVVAFYVKENNKWECKNNTHLFCAKYDEKEKIFSFSKYINNKQCSTKWTTLKYSEELCDSLKKETELKEYEFIDFNKMCN